MEVAKIVGIGIVAGILSITLKKTNPEMSMHISIAAGILIFLMLFGYLKESIEFIKNLADKYAQAGQAVTIMLKILGIAYLCEFAVHILKDAGESAVASKVELGGKLIIMVITLPMITSFLDTIIGFLS